MMRWGNEVKMVDKEADRFWFLVRSSCQWRWSCRRRMLLSRRRLLPWPGPGKARNWLCPSESWFLHLIINVCGLVCLWAPVACKLKQFILQIGAHCVCVLVFFLSCLFLFVSTSLSLAWSSSQITQVFADMCMRVCSQALFCVLGPFVAYIHIFCLCVLSCVCVQTLTLSHLN